MGKKLATRHKEYQKLPPSQAFWGKKRAEHGLQSATKANWVQSPSFQFIELYMNETEYKRCASQVMWCAVIIKLDKLINVHVSTKYRPMV